MEQKSAWTPKINPWYIAVIVSLAAFMELLDTSIANVALPHIAGSLGATNDESTWVLTSYLASNAIVLPMSGWFANAFGRKRFFMVCVGLFTASSILCGLSNSLPMLILFRVLQGAGGGALQPMAQAILADTFPPEKRGTAFTVFGLTAVVAPALGPTLGGWITDNYSWPWIFFINLPTGLLLLGMLYWVLEDPPYLKELRAAAVKMDYVGIGLLALGIATLQVFLDKGQTLDWTNSHLIVTLMTISAISLTSLVVWEWFQKNPVVEVRLFTNRNFWIANVLMFGTGIIMFSSIVLMPQFLQSLMGYSATKAGLVLSAAACVMFVTFPVTAQLCGKFQGRKIIGVGAAFMALAFAYSAARTNILTLDFRAATWLMIVQQALIPLVWLPINLVAFVGIPQEKSNSVSGLLNFMRNMGSSVGTSIVTTLIARGSQAYQVQLVNHLTPYNPQAVAAFYGLAERLGSEQQAMATIYRAVQGQAATLSYIHTYQVLGGILMAMILGTLLLRKNQPGGGHVSLH